MKYTKAHANGLTTHGQVPSWGNLLTLLYTQLGEPQLSSELSDAQKRECIKQVIGRGQSNHSPSPGRFVLRITHAH
jgi:hypothetical protein